MIRGWLMVVVASVIGVLGVGRYHGQDTGGLRYVPSPDDIAQFFQGQLSGSDHIARAYCRDLHLMGEEPLVVAKSPQAPQIFRMVVETRPYNVPVVVRLTIGTDGMGEVVAKFAQSARFPDTLTMNRTAAVPSADVNEFLKLLTDSGFWLKPVRTPLDIKHVVMGEPSWMLEGNKEGSYHVIWRDTSGLTSLKEAVMFFAVNIGKVDLASTARRPGDGDPNPNF
jgi:hypothetical protein